MNEAVDEIGDPEQIFNADIDEGDQEANEMMRRPTHFERVIELEELKIDHIPTLAPCGNVDGASPDMGVTKKDLDDIIEA